MNEAGLYGYMIAPHIQNNDVVGIVIIYKFGITLKQLLSWSDQLKRVANH